MRMPKRTASEMADFLLDENFQTVTFLTGAGVSTPSGIPDYRSMDGIYTKTGLARPEYLLSRRAMLHDTELFHKFIIQLYHEGAKPNVIHEAMAGLQNVRRVNVITQNIDGLHHEAGQKNLVEFHGTLAACHCEKCGRTVDKNDFIATPIHENCGGVVRPDIVLYDEPIDSTNFMRAEQMMEQADLVVIVGTSFEVYPFAGLIEFKNRGAKVAVINKDEIYLDGVHEKFFGDASLVFEELMERF
jgi:NAD-dependent deacetylase